MAITLGMHELTLERALRCALDGMMVLGSRREVVYFSDACERLTGSGRDQVMGTRDGDGIASGALRSTIKACDAVFEGKVRHVTATNAFPHGESMSILETHYTPVLDDVGQIIGVVGIMRDISQHKNGHPAVISSSTADRHQVAGGADSGAPERGRGAGNLDQMLGAIERREILDALNRARGRRTLAAQLLGISRSRLYRRMDALSIRPEEVPE